MDWRWLEAEITTYVCSHGTQIEQSSETGDREIVVFDEEGGSYYPLNITSLAQYLAAAITNRKPKP